VLIGGESGTGKEVLARYVHAASPRAGAPFVALNCAALPRDLLETELFGIERGVATGVEARAGKFELAHGGTLFLDEIGDMALDTQARILRVLQEREVYRIGGQAPRKAAVRVVAATNRDVPALLAEGRFREDLYYRIATWVVELPPLRARAADIPNLAAHFLGRECGRRGVRARGISRAALEALRAYPWPGNVRQLENEMARAALFLADDDVLDTSRLSPFVRQPAAAADGGRLEDALLHAEREAIRRALHAHGLDVSAAAATLGLGRSTLYRRMKALGLSNEPDA
jgi:transcriptional regulator with PAS, ATPase and Fis domain